MEVDQDVRTDVMRRLHRAEGQLRGAMAMLESGRDCVEVLTQMVAVSHAVNGAGFLIMRNGLQQCTAPQRAGGDADQARAVARLERQLEKLFLSWPEPGRRCERSQDMATVALTRKTFEQSVAAGGIVLVDFWAGWCGPCRRFAPVYEQASRNHTDIVFGKVDTEAEQDLAAAAGIYSIPTLMAIRDGIVVFAQPGALPPAALEQVISAVRGLDMDDVRAKLGAERASTPTG